MLLRQFLLGNNLPTHIRENIDFPGEKPGLARFGSKKNNMNNASSYFKLNGRPSIVHHFLI